MRFVRRILGLGLVAAGVVYLRGRRSALRAARGADARFESSGFAGPRSAPAGSVEVFDDNFGTTTPVDGDMVAVATESGIADVDPTHLSHVAGEGIDPVRDRKAHEEIADVRERMPRH